MSWRGRAVEGSDNKHSMTGEPEETSAGGPNVRAFAAAAIVVGLFGAVLIGVIGILGVAILVRPQESVRAMENVHSYRAAGSVIAPGMVLNHVDRLYASYPATVSPLTEPAAAAEASPGVLCRRLRMEILDGEGSRVQLILDGEPLGEASDSTERQVALTRLEQRLSDSSKGRDLELSVPKGVNSLLVSRVVSTLIAAKMSFELLNQDRDSSR